MEKEMATHSSVLAWRITGMGKSGGLPSMGSQSQTRLKWLSSSSRLHNTFYHAPSIVHPSSSLSWNSSVSSISHHKTPLLYSTNGFLKMFFKICWVGRYSSTISHIAFFFFNPSTYHFPYCFFLPSQQLSFDWDLHLNPKSSLPSYAKVFPLFWYLKSQILRYLEFIPRLYQHIFFQQRHSFLSPNEILMPLLRWCVCVCVCV